MTHYLSLSKTTAENLTQHFAVVMAARLAEQVPGEREHLLKELQKYVATP